MSKGRKAKKKATSAQRKANSTNHRRKQQYSKYSTVATVENNGDGKVKGKKGPSKYSGRGLTKAQKKRLALGRPLAPVTTYESSFGSSTSFERWKPFWL